MNRGKDVYDRIAIPVELSERVNTAIASIDKKEVERKAKIKQRNRKMMTFVRSAGAVAASFLVCLTVGVNSSQVLAEGIGGLPVIGPLAQVLTVRTYEEQSGDINLQAEVPEIQMATVTGTGGVEEAAPEERSGTNEGISLADAGGGENSSNSGDEVITDSKADKEFVITESEYVGDINAEIDKIVEDFIAQAKQDMADYRTAFFETGGTEEEWADRTMDVNVNYEVKYQEGAWLSLVLHVDECWVYAYQENYYYNLDLENQRDITLEDMLGADYINICNNSIITQIEEQISTDESKTYFGYGPHVDEFEEEMKFTTVTEETDFYINQNGNVVICFTEYEIAPGYMGVCEFEIKQ
ncbi:MAG: DUF3298 domain-containing protein [Lachnospiraceae bacterium]|nr:DUF3298 domain-containing protein [Lachnospiraceae bacterium]